MVTDFIALDVETANSDFASICAIGLVHFRKGEVFKSLSILIDPEDDFSPTNIAIHGIRPEHVIGKPTMAKAFPIIGTALDQAAVVHHSPFDRTAMARAAARYGVSGLPCTWIDSSQIARRAWPQFKGNGGYGLAHLCSLFDIQFQHHDAAEDARAAGLIVQHAINHTGIPFAQWVDDYGYQSTTADYVPHRIKPPTYTNQNVKRTGLEGGPLNGEVVVFTGALDISRSEAADIAAKAGCDVSGSVTKKTTILVVGDQDLRATNGEKKSSKHRKAEEYIAQGQSIRIVGQTDFMMMVS